MGGIWKLKFPSEEQKPCSEIRVRFKSGSGSHCLFQRLLISDVVAKCLQMEVQVNRQTDVA